MPPPRRPPSPQSIHSWWSDSNPTGATISLHTLAKPLSKYLYHRQALGVIERTRPWPVSKEILDDLTCYLEAKEIASSTKILILQDLDRRAQKEAQAQVVVQENVHLILIHLLHSPESSILESACTILGNLAVWRSGNAAIVDSNHCELLVTLSKNGDPTVKRQAIYALSHIGSSAQGTQTFIEAKGTELAIIMLQSTDTRILKYATRMLGRISNHAEALKIPIGRLDACIHLVSLAEHSDASVQQEALSTLASISVGSEIGAQAIAGARDLGWTIRLAYSPVDSIRGSALQILGSIARHESTKARVYTLSEDLISLVRVRCPSGAVSARAMDILGLICQSPDGSTAVANVLRCQLASPEGLKLEPACKLLWRLQENESLGETISYICSEGLISLLEYPQFPIRRALVYSFVNIQEVHLGKALNKVLAEIFRLLESPEAEILYYPCYTLGNIASSVSLWKTATQLGRPKSLIPLWSHNDSYVRNSALYATTQMVQHPYSLSTDYEARRKSCEFRYTFPDLTVDLVYGWQL
ncbi:armadillo-type protein [Mycena epipterygia]|nr:armadillo-type protein [Mycena epipterygia]